MMQTTYFCNVTAGILRKNKATSSRFAVGFRGYSLRKRRSPNRSTQAQARDQREH
jgi:hypothetical protein